VLSLRAEKGARVKAARMTFRGGGEKGVLYKRVESLYIRANPERVKSSAASRARSKTLTTGGEKERWATDRKRQLL